MTRQPTADEPEYGAQTDKKTQHDDPDVQSGDDQQMTGASGLKRLLDVA
jgi:hypothetical protein